MFEIGDWLSPKESAHMLPREAIYQVVDVESKHYLADLILRPPDADLADVFISIPIKAEHEWRTPSTTLTTKICVECSKPVYAGDDYLCVLCRTK